MTGVTILILLLPPFPLGCVGCLRPCEQGLGKSLEELLSRSPEILTDFALKAGCAEQAMTRAVFLPTAQCAKTIVSLRQFPFFLQSA
jgi:hypothetical protein